MRPRLVKERHPRVRGRRRLHQSRGKRHPEDRARESLLRTQVDRHVRRRDGRLVRLDQAREPTDRRAGAVTPAGIAAFATKPCRVVAAPRAEELRAAHHVLGAVGDTLGARGVGADRPLDVLLGAAVALARAGGERREVRDQLPELPEERLRRGAVSAPGAPVLGCPLRRAVAGAHQRQPQRIRRRVLRIEPPHQRIRALGERLASDGVLLALKQARERRGHPLEHRLPGRTLELELGLLLEVCEHEVQPTDRFEVRRRPVGAVARDGKIGPGRARGQGVRDRSITRPGRLTERRRARGKHRLIRGVGRHDAREQHLATRTLHGIGIAKECRAGREARPRLEPRRHRSPCARERPQAAGALDRVA